MTGSGLSISPTSSVALALRAPRSTASPAVAVSCVVVLSGRRRQRDRNPLALISSQFLQLAVRPAGCQEMVAAVCEIARRVLQVDRVDLVLFEPGLPLARRAGAAPWPTRGQAAGPAGGLSLAVSDAGRQLGTLTLQRPVTRTWTAPERAGARLVADLLGAYLALAVSANPLPIRHPAEGT